jgi:hypothetical protein
MELDTNESTGVKLKDLKARGKGASKCFQYCYSGVAPALDSEMQIGSCPWLPLPAPYSNPLTDPGPGLSKSR